jgi:hypothetical protein
VHECGDHPADRPLEIEADPVSEPLKPSRPLLADAGEIGEGEELPPRRAVRKLQLAGQVGGAAADVEAPPLGAESEMVAAPGRPNQVEEEADGRRLADPVRAQKPKTSHPDLQIQILDATALAVELGQPGPRSPPRPC